MLRKAYTVIMVVLTMVIAACGRTPQLTPMPTSTPSPPPPTATLPALSADRQATSTPLPTNTLQPTATPLPTNTLTPTDEPTSTLPPTPANTPTPTLPPTPEKTPAPVVELTPIGAITADRVGEKVTVEGTVVGAASFSAGFKFTLDDGTGQITLLMWHNVYDDCWDAPEINLGAKVRATGEIGQYEGELQIQPSFGGDVQAIEGAAAWAVSREIASITGGDAGQ
ncbi:MAG: OB-fold nucleic acid binding domain-containing protein, partial [Anaerolineae bacterium]